MRALAIAMLAGGRVTASSRPAAAARSGARRLSGEARGGHQAARARSRACSCSLAVKEGSQVRQGQVIGKIDDSEAADAKEGGRVRLCGAPTKRRRTTCEIRFAKHTAAVAEKDYEQLLESNRLAAKAVAEVEVTQGQAGMGSLQSWRSKRPATTRSWPSSKPITKQAELDAAELAIERRTIVAPFDGEVVTINRHQDEWVSPGDPILRLVRLDTMHVEGAVEQSEYDPHEMQGCDVTVEVEMARGRKEQFTGRIIYVSSLVRCDGTYNVRAEVANRQEHGNWLLRDGMPATMTIHLEHRRQRRAAT